MDTLPHSWVLLRRWMIFNIVGIMGIAVQMAILLTLVSRFGFGYLPATALAVEGAVLHNFFWHECWTWSDRIGNHPAGFFARILKFHLTNGAVSITGNLILMRLFAGELGLNYVFANALSIALCSIFNFMAGDRFVFRSGRKIS